MELRSSKRACKEDELPPIAIEVPTDESMRRKNRELIQQLIYRVMPHYLSDTIHRSWPTEDIYEFQRRPDPQLINTLRAWQFIIKDREKVQLMADYVSIRFKLEYHIRTYRIREKICPSEPVDELVVRGLLILALTRVQSFEIRRYVQDHLHKADLRFYERALTTDDHLDLKDIGAIVDFDLRQKLVPILRAEFDCVPHRVTMVDLNQLEVSKGKVMYHGKLLPLRRVARVEDGPGKKKIKDSL